MNRFLIFFALGATACHLQNVDPSDGSNLSPAGQGSNNGQDELCQNGIDDDGDGLVDCADVDCETFVRCGGDLGSAENCADGLDNDEDGALDCQDSECADTLPCASGNALCEGGNWSILSEDSPEHVVLATQSAGKVLLEVYNLPPFGGANFDVAEQYVLSLQGFDVLESSAVPLRMSLDAQDQKAGLFSQLGRYPEGNYSAQLLEYTPPTPGEACSGWVRYQMIYQGQFNYGTIEGPFIKN